MLTFGKNKIMSQFFRLYLFIIAIFLQLGLSSQSETFDIHIEPINIQGVGGLQSFAWGQDDGKWLIIGGRLDGLHQRQPFAAFDVAGHNNQIIVIDPSTKQKWSIGLSSLPVGIQEQLSSTNMEFHQDGEMLYMVGGYGYSATFGDHTTYAKMTAVNVKNTIQAVINGNSVTPYFRQISDSKFGVTGGYLNKIYNTYYLTGGQKFIGRYNPMGPDHGPGFEQEYTDAIRKFNINDDGALLSVTHLTNTIDKVNLHRRDYNVLPQIMPNGEEGLTAFSGVFQQTVDLPFLNCVNIDSSGYKPDPNFLQYYNHYHCAHIPLYSESKNEMHNVFFGGIAQYYENQGLLIKDDNVPFVKTIARVTRDLNGKMTEYKLPIEMPTYLGAGSEFIPTPGLQQYSNGVLKLDELENDTTLVGYIYGGIASNAKNIFFTNTGTQSNASSQIFKVYLTNKNTVGSNEINDSSLGNLKIDIFPNPNKGSFEVRYNLIKASKVKISIYDLEGHKLEETPWVQNNVGLNTYYGKIDIHTLLKSVVITLQTETESVSKQIIIEI